MPTYEYLCNACGYEFEREQRITDPKIKTCPKCRKRKVERLISQTSFVLKGGGWYNDLYSSKKDAPAKEGADSGAASDKSEGASDGKSGSKGSDAGGDDKPSKGKGGKKSKGSKAAA